jgi:hypothetical protein
MPGVRFTGLQSRTDEALPASKVLFTTLIAPVEATMPP